MMESPAPPTARLRVIDLETTGDSFANGGVVEIGWQDLAQGADGSWDLDGIPGSRLVRPDFPISAVTSAIHHIVEEDVAEARPWAEVAPDILRGGHAVALAAHRAAFEQRWCTPALSGRARWICTWKCALRVWPDAPTHSNQGLRYWRSSAGLDRATGLPAHRAGPDAYVTAHHLRDMLALASVDRLLAWSAEPALLVRVPSGPLRGRRWDELDGTQLGRALEGAFGRNPDMLFTARTELARRGGGSGSPEQPRLDV
ncbi:DNA polymerase III subunit epsilon [Roseomonas indoligenes]|uniref:DNA polymerase III subunit epsilon n=1 Tax=Roseomonas indoligenes TaxID=2820811 RepID=A0A940N6T0_9PROT|nr:DNA polymerase III subunit epsilon [Pararoseomonas indoligenes]MBP0495157.1 DNA polymerase III subunit epsilon [Pararoseomonas indoligenes]